jgi:hypothetical protein
MQVIRPRNSRFLSGIWFPLVCMESQKFSRKMQVSGLAPHCASGAERADKYAYIFCVGLVDYRHMVHSPRVESVYVKASGQGVFVALSTAITPP